MSKLYPRMFISQTTLESWIDAGGAEVRENIAFIPRIRRAYVLEPAVKILSGVLGDTEDKLVGKVLTERRILELGGEMMGTSVLLGESAFEVEPGFVGSLRSADEEQIIQDAGRKGVG